MPTDPTELRGPAGVRADVTAFLRAHLPAHIDGCRYAWGLPAARLPAPANVPEDNRIDAYLDHEPAALDRWPLVAVTTGRRTHRAVDFSDDGSPLYRAMYPIRVYSWVRDEGYEATADQRDNLGTAVSVTVLSHINLGSSGRMRVDPGTVVVDFSDVTPVKGDRFVAGSYVGFDLHVEETLTDRLAMPAQQPRDTVSSVIATGEVLPHLVDIIEDGS